MLKKHKWIIGLVLVGALGYTQSGAIQPMPVPGSAISIPAAPASEEIKVHFIDVGQADSIYIQLPNHEDILIDGGNVDDGARVVDYLKSQGMDNDLELLIATHPHEDHIGGLPDVMSAFQVKEIIDSGVAAKSDIYNQYYDSALAEHCTWLADNRQTLTFGKVVLQILTGPEIWPDLNDDSVVARLDCGQVEFLFSGDAEASAEASLPGDISAEILKVGHHGSASSSSVDFLSRVKPQVAIISVGAGNDYGHPARETLASLQAVGAKVYRTDQDGDITITTDGNTYSVHTEKGRSSSN
jgi:competence protein ComEC